MNPIKPEDIISGFEIQSQDYCQKWIKEATKNLRLKAEIERLNKIIKILTVPSRG